MLKQPRAILAIAVLPAVLGLAACGGGNNSSDTGTTAASSAGASGATVSTQSIAGTGTVLVDSKGQALYTNDMDTASKIACTGECPTVWIPLTGAPTSSDSGVQAKLGTVKRPDGTSQVTWNGLPLYTFAQDTPGQVTGNGVADSFGGTNFVWTAATSGGSAAAPTTTGGSSGGGSSGGYGGY